MRPPIHPGGILREELDELGVSAAKASRSLHVPSQRISQIMTGKRAITADTAIRLGLWQGTGPDIWMNLQNRTS